MVLHELSCFGAEQLTSEGSQLGEYLSDNGGRCVAFEALVTARPLPEFTVQLLPGCVVFHQLANVLIHGLSYVKDAVFVFHPPYHTLQTFRLLTAIPIAVSASE
jgi:hypothetical protein